MGLQNGVSGGQEKLDVQLVHAPFRLQSPLSMLLNLTQLSDEMQVVQAITEGVISQYENAGLVQFVEERQFTQV